jgi:hypothetical protein
MRQAILYPGEIGYWVAECPSLPEALTICTSAMIFLILKVGLA